MIISYSIIGLKKCVVVVVSFCFEIICALELHHEVNKII